MSLFVVIFAIYSPSRLLSRDKRDPSFIASIREIKLLYYNNNSSMCQFRNAKCAHVVLLSA